MPLLRESGGALLAALLVVSQGCGQAERQGERTGAPARETRAEAPARPAVAPLPLDAEGRAWVDARLAEMGLRERVAQLVFPWISGKAIGEAPAEADRLARWAGVERVGGVIISTGTPPPSPPS
jgi:hypothetical protein